LFWRRQGILIERGYPYVVGGNKQYSGKVLGNSSVM
jgi:hypothetical protein